MPQFPPYIFGVHDPGAEGLLLGAGKPGWIVFSVKASDGGGDYSGYASQGFGVIVRLNYGYNPDGTIPNSSQYDVFAQQCAAFVAGSRGAGIWIIGNETNLAAERPGGESGELITPDLYAQCFAKCRAKILAVPGHADDLIAPAPPGPWNPQTTYPGNPGGDWIKYYQDILNRLVQMGAPPGALALHTYTHGSDAALIASEERMDGFPNYHKHLRAYRDFLSVVHPLLRVLPVFITETQPADPNWWQNRNTGWIQAAYAEINAWNAVPANQPVQALCLFRWQPGDGRWSISDKPAVQDDFRAALQNAYRVRMPAVPAPQPAQPQHAQPQPTTPTQPPPAPPQPTISGWCPFATQRLITTNNYDVGRSGQKVKAVVLHIAAGPMSAVFPTFNNPAGLTSAHFCVGKDGSIEQYVSIDDTAYGNGLKFTNGQWFNARGVLVQPTWQDLQSPNNPNLYTISIEHDGQPEDQWTPEMYAA
ncbi:MAG: N-acetylmuramoyl-L-alanine amidase, partial [Acidobacteriota bacterium]